MDMEGEKLGKENVIAALDWTFAYDSFDPDEEGLREAITSTGNGYFCSRGAAEWADADDVHYPGTYMHGGYNRETTIMAGRPVLNEDLVNLPNWLVLKLQIEDELVNVNNVEMLSYRHELDVRNATVVRAIRFRDRAGRETTLLGRRFVSIADMHQGAIEWTITPENWSGKVLVISALDNRVMNRGVARYRQLEGRHLEPDLTRAIGPDVIALRARTRQSHIYIAEAARTRVYGEHEVVSVDRDLYQTDNYIQETLTFDVKENSPVRVEKMVALYSSRDHAINEPLANAIKAVVRYEPFAEALTITPGPGTSFGPYATCAYPRTAGSSFWFACTSPTYCRSARRTRLTWTLGCRPAALTAKPTAAMSSGTNSTFTRSSTSGCPR